MRETVLEFQCSQSLAFDWEQSHTATPTHKEEEGTLKRRLKRPVATMIKNVVKDRLFIPSTCTSVCVAQQVHDAFQYLWMCIAFSGVSGGDSPSRQQTRPRSKEHAVKWKLYVASHRWQESWCTP